MQCLIYSLLVKLNFMNVKWRDSKLAFRYDYETLASSAKNRTDFINVHRDFCVNSELLQRLEPSEKSKSSLDGRSTPSIYDMAIKEVSTAIKWVETHTFEEQDKVRTTREPVPKLMLANLHITPLFT